MAPAAAYQRLCAVLPEFASFWDSPENLFRDKDGSYTLCGLFSMLGWFVRDGFDSLNSDQLAALGAQVSDWMTEPDSVLDEAVATCFLENLSFEPFSRRLESVLSGEARVYFRALHAAEPGVAADAEPE